MAVLPTIAGLTGDSYLHPAVFSAGFHVAVLIAAGACVVGALIAILTIRNPGHGAAEPPREGWQCALDAPPLFGENDDASAGSSVIAGQAAGMGS